jgi:hypothetical protein
LDSYTNVSSESDEFSSSTALATLASKTSAFEEALHKLALVNVYRYKKDGDCIEGLRIAISWLEEMEISYCCGYSTVLELLETKGIVSERGQKIRSGPRVPMVMVRDE